MKEPRAMALATLSATGEVHNRIVLLKQIVPEGLIFFSNYHSSKGQDLAARPQVEALFYWDHLQRQVRVGGAVEKTSRKISEDYWNSRARLSQLSSFVSHQSAPVPDRDVMEEALTAADQRFQGQPIPCPPHWGGYLIRPERMELWMGKEGRFHDRFLYRKIGSGWTSTRLFP